MSKLGSGTAKIMLGRMLSMVIGFGTAPITSRLFTPEQYGIAGLVESVVVWAAAFGGLSYAQAMPLSSGRGETRSLIRLSLLLTSALLVPLLLATAFGRGLFSRVVGEPVLKSYFWFVPVLFLLVCLRQVATYTFSRERKFGWLAATQSSMAVVARPVHICLGYFVGGSALFLLLGSMAGGVAAIAVAAVAFLPIMMRKGGDDASPQPTLRAVAARHAQFPKAQMWNGVLDVSSRSLPVLLMGAFFSTEVVGYYSHGSKLIMLPLTLLAASIAQVFYPEGADEWRRTGSVSNTILGTVRILSVTCVFPILSLGLLGPLLFKTILGEKWYEAGVYAQILAPWVLMVLICSPTSTVFLIRQRAHLGLVYTAVLMVLRPGALVVGHWLDSPRLALLLFSGAGFAVLLHRLNLTMKLGVTKRRQVAGIILKEGALSCALLLPAALVYWVGVPAFISDRLDAIALLVRLAGAPAAVSNVLRGSAAISLALLAAAAMAYALLVYRREPAVRAKLRDVLDRFRGKGAQPAECWPQQGEKGYSDAEI